MDLGVPTTSNTGMLLASSSTARLGRKGQQWWTRENRMWWFQVEAAEKAFEADGLRHR